MKRLHWLLTCPTQKSVTRENKIINSDYTYVKKIVSNFLPFPALLVEFTLGKTSRSFFISGSSHSLGVIKSFIPIYLNSSPLASLIKCAFYVFCQLLLFQIFVGNLRFTILSSEYHNSSLKFPHQCLVIYNTTWLFLLAYTNITSNSTDPKYKPSTQISSTSC